MKATYNCPYCGAANIVPEDKFGLHYNCFNCGNEFKIMRHVDCPHCGANNLLEDPNRTMTYRCGNCNEKFTFNEQPVPGREIVQKSRTDAIVDLLISPFSAQIKAFSINGRASRAEFAGSLFVLSVMLYAAFSDAHSHFEGNYGVVVFLFLLYSFFSTATCLERRAHDCEKEDETNAVFAWYVLAAVLTLILLPVVMVMAIKAIVVLLFTPGVPYRNQYGDPA